MDKENNREKELAIIAEHTPAIYEQTSDEEIFKKAGEIIELMGYKCAILSDNGTHLRLSYISLSPQMVKTAKALTGMDANDFQMPHENYKAYDRIKAENKPFLMDDPHEFITDVMDKAYKEYPSARGYLVKGFSSIIEIIINKIFPEAVTRAILSPLFFNDEISGFFAVFGSKITESDIPTVHHFSQIMSSAIKLKNIEMERQRLQNQLLHAQKMDAIGQLAGGVAHDFNNMLGIIVGYTQMILSDMEEDNPYKGDLAEVLEAALRSKDLTMKLLTFARKEKLCVSPHHVAKLVDDIKNILDRGLGKTLQIKTSIDDSIMVLADTNQLHQAILNICVNARDAMPDGGTLYIEARRVTETGRTCKICNKNISGDFCLLQISDTGIGMPQEISSRIFEPFFTTKGVGKGTGLGLSTTLGIIQNHEGHVSIYTEPGQGTTFKVLLPLRDEPSQTNQISPKAAPPATGSETVMVVDDEKGMMELAEKILKKAGYRVISCSSGAQAVEIFSEQHQNIDLVILDIIMPEMDGAEVFSRIKEIQPGTKVIIASGYSINGKAGDLMKKGANAFVQKPFLPSELWETVSQVLNG